MRRPYSKRTHYLFNFFKAIVRLVFPKHKIAGMEHVTEFPAVFLCNHAGPYAPVAMELYFPVPFRPWVIYKIMTPKLCGTYLEADFTKKELRLRPPFSKWVAALIEPFCRRIMDSAEAIPVYKGSRDIRQTFDLSLDAMLHGDNLLIFPENPEKKYSESFDEFHTGFLHLSKLYYKAAGRPLAFYPTFVSKKKKTITIGRPIQVGGAKGFGGSKESLRLYFQKAMEEIAR